MLPLPCDSWDATGVAAWLAHGSIAASSSAAPMVANLRAAGFESWILSRAIAVLGPGGVKDEPLGGWTDAQLLAEVAGLERAVDVYRSGQAALRTSAATCGRLLVEQRSRETLVVWAAYCLTDHIARRLHPQMDGYCMSLRFGDLRHLSLADGLAHDALLAICGYLRTRTSGDGAPHRPVFSLRSGDATMQLAAEVGRASESIMAAWRTEQQHALQRRDGHWREVQHKQALARRLRDKLAQQRTALQEAEETLQIAPYGSTGRYASAAERRLHQERQSLVAVVEQHFAAVAATATGLQAAEKAPVHVVQPLPSGQDAALAVLLFLYMPPALRLLSRLSFEAQAALLPQPLSDKDKAALEVPALPFDCADHHANHQTCIYYTPSPAVRAGAKGDVALVARMTPPYACTFGPSHVDHFSSADQGVWHPDGALELNWRNMNPFALLPSARLVESWTEALPEHAAELQWAMQQAERGETARTRGNQAVAAQDERPRWLSKPQFLAFAALRSYPHLQRRKLCCALRDRALPLAHPVVQLLIRQALYHVGALRGDGAGGATELTWKADLLTASAGGGALAALRFELAQLVDELADSIANHGALLCAIDVFLYVRHFDDDADRDAVRRRSVAVARKWIVALEPRIEATVIAAEVASLRSKQCIFAMYGVLAHGGTDALEEEDLASLCQLIVLAHNGYVYQPDAADPAEFAVLRARCRAVMAQRFAALQAAATDAVLTAAVRGALHRVPAELSWSHQTVGPAAPEHGTGCFEAVSPAPDAHLYSINLLTGAVLLDGSPPRSLPADVLAHPLYQRTFGERDFEVLIADSGALLTLRPLSGYFYEFFFFEGRLCITERPQQGDTGDDALLELLDITAEDAVSWSGDLPLRLRELHSHWLCRASGVVLLRPPRLPERHVSFVIRLGAGALALNGDMVLRVPRHLRARPWRELVTLAQDADALPDALVVWCSPAAGAPAAAVRKFESLSFAHWYRSRASGRFRLELPRYKLEFELLQGRLLSADYAGYVLAQRQQLDDTLAGFTQYLLLEPGPTLLTQHPWGGPVKLLVPAGGVRRDSARGVAAVSGSDAAGALRACRAYDVHARFGELRSRSIEARLQLAALYAASDRALPEPRSRMTGAEAAMELVRRCFVNRPLTAEEQAQCASVAALSRQTPALHLLCAHLSATASQLDFLHPGVAAAEAERNAQQEDRLADSITEYLSLVQRGACNPRGLLTPAEELRIIGMRSGPQPPPARRMPRAVGAVVGLSQPPVDACYVSEAELRLAALVLSTPAPAQTPPCPLHEKQLPEADRGELATEMMAELAASWDAHQSLPVQSLRADVADPPALRALLQDELARAALRRAAMEAYLMDASRAEPAPDAPHAWHAPAYRLLRAAGRVPQATMPDLVRTLWTPTLARDLNVFVDLSDADCAQLTAAVLTWLQLAVLEDKLTRLTRMAEAAASAGQDIIKELVTRTWVAADHPEWLAFEVDGALQIRPAQHAVVDAVLHTPGAIVQLNMGEGKTRVIVPMLVLHWTRQRDALVRLHFLPHLLPDAFDYLHEHLSAGILAKPLFQLPFQRDVALTPARAAALLAAAAYCRAAGGAALVSPEGRASLHLKQHELRRERRDDECAALEAFEQLPWLDVYDESDEVLRVKFQLIYAVGEPAGLPALQERCATLHALLRALHDEHGAAAAVLRDARVAVCDRGGRPPGAFFAALRLLPGAALERARPALDRALAAAVLTAPPYELRWLTKFGQIEAVLAYVTDADRAADDILPPSAFWSEAHRDALLSLRGLLAFGVLAHCLRLRHRVDYGAAHPGPTRRKRLAVPFRACDVPSERAEFAHQDCALVLTTLSYYYNGLSDGEVMHAFGTLLSLGPTEQAERYASWFDAVRAGLAPAHAAALDSVRKLDLSNELQATLLCDVYRRSRDVVDYWLRACVLPAETAQFGHRLKASAWHLAPHDGGGGAAVGFSGTNDQHRLLPMHARQLPLPDRGLEATNGRMLAFLLAHAAYAPLPPAPAGGGDAWRHILAFAVRSGAAALVDAGALLAGVSMADAAAHTLQLLHANCAAADSALQPLRAVVYFDGAAGHGGAWIVRGADDSSWPLSSSPVRERDAFVLFDERNCRGADMRLRRRAKALVTLGPRCCKDKLMQAAGRMRQLGMGQTLLLTAQPDVHDAIRAASGAQEADAVSVAAALRWVMGNTVAASRSGLMEWARNGVHFAATRDSPAAALLADEHSLQAFYAPPLVCRAVADAVALDAAAWRAAAAVGGAGGGVIVDEVVRRARRYGGGAAVRVSALDEECERELERETEREEEVMLEVPAAEPRSEHDWDVTTAAQRGIEGVTQAAPDTQHLADAVASLLRPAELLCAVAWRCADEASDVWLTANFARTLHAAEDLSLYQRPVDALVALPLGGTLLVSDREADAIVQEAHASPRAAAGAQPWLLHLSYVRGGDAKQAAWLALQARPGGAGGAAAFTAPLSDAVLARLQLLNGETTFGGAHRRAALAELLPTRAARDAALLLPAMRGNGHLLARSHLEEACAAAGEPL